MMFQPMNAATEDENATHNRVHIKHVKLCKLVVGSHFAAPLASRQIALVREELSWGSKWLKESSVSRFVRVAAAGCLQKISKHLKRT
jgi:hypothetical protein